MEVQHPASKPIGKLIDANEVAERLHVSVATIRWLRHRGDLPPAIKIGKRIFWPVESIESYLAEQFEKASA
jgi:predicted DNA-binding transcriptional regulator AlpA